MENNIFSSLKIRIDNKSFKNKVLYKNSTVFIDKNKKVMIIGDSGAGKTTLLKLLMGIDLEFNGSWEFNGIETEPKKRWNLIKKNSSFIFQDVYLIDYLSVLDNIMLPYNFNKKAIDSNYLADLMKTLNVENLANEKAYKLSGGEKQRVAIIRALITKPSLLFADEPTASLDDTNVEQFMNYLDLIVKKYNVSVVMVSHRKSLASRFDVVYEITDQKIYEKNNF